MNIRNIHKAITYGLFTMMLAAFASCDDGKSYADMLDDERDAVNWYLAQQEVVAAVPEDSVFITGPDAPFYRMTAEGSVYMRVVNPGDPDNKPVSGQTIYFRYTLYDLLSMYDTKDIDASGIGNSATVTNGAASFILGNTVLSSTTDWGTGIQVPMKYLGYNCEVDLIVKSVDGQSQYIANCIPLLYKGMKFFKAEY